MLCSQDRARVCGSYDPPTPVIWPFGSAPAANAPTPMALPAPAMSGRESNRLQTPRIGATAALHAQGVGKSVGHGAAMRPLLHGLDLDVAVGEMVAVLGRSGSGKSTLLHLLGGLDRADEGEIVVGSESLTGASERELTRLRLRHVGFVFQSFQLIEELSGAENVLLPTTLPGAPPGGRVRAQHLIEERRAW
jgi:ABC-type sugar transport system ATPase subunit